MTIYFATDHAGFELKESLLKFVKNQLGYTVVDCGAEEYDKEDDYPDFVHVAARSVSADPTHRRAIILGASGQGEAMVANRYKGVRAAVYYGQPTKKQTDASGQELDIITSTRQHNDANVLSLGARFLNQQEAEEVVKEWLKTEFTGEERHLRRIKKFDN